MIRLAFFLFIGLLIFLVYHRIIDNPTWLYVIAVNLLATFLMYYDKKIAIFGKTRARIPEKWLFIVAFVGGAPFLLLSMFIFRHKILKIKFLIGIPLLFLWNVFILYKLILR